MSPGATPEASVDNLVAWLDTVVISLGLHATFVYDGNNTRIMGCYSPARNSLQNSVAQQISSGGTNCHNWTLLWAHIGGFWGTSGTGTGGMVYII